MKINIHANGCTFGFTVAEPFDDSDVVEPIQIQIDVDDVHVVGLDMGVELSADRNELRVAVGTWPDGKNWEPLGDTVIGLAAEATTTLSEHERYHLAARVAEPGADLSGYEPWRDEDGVAWVFDDRTATLWNLTDGVAPPTE